jgi:hypothetical protein
MQAGRKNCGNTSFAIRPGEVASFVETDCVSVSANIAIINKDNSERPIRFMTPSELKRTPAQTSYYADQQRPVQPRRATTQTSNDPYRCIASRGCSPMHSAPAWSMQCGPLHLRSSFTQTETQYPWWQQAKLWLLGFCARILDLDQQPCILPARLYSSYQRKIMNAKNVRPASKRRKQQRVPEAVTARSHTSEARGHTMPTSRYGNAMLVTIIAMFRQKRTQGAKSAQASAC